MIKTVWRVYILVMIGLLCVAGCTKQKVDVPPVPPEGMVLIPAGEFLMGNNAPVACKDEQPVHTVYIDAFFMDKYEVTNAQYKKFVDANPQWGKNRIDSNLHDGTHLKHWNGNDYPSGEANHPVRYVSWYAAMAYAQWAGKRLPAEAEWERAARGDLVGKKYLWGDSFDLSKVNHEGTVIMYKDEANLSLDGFRDRIYFSTKTFGLPSTKTVGSYPSNGYGLYDMACSVWEWCLDEYDENFYARSPRDNPIAGGAITSIINNFTNLTTKRVLRGGVWDGNPESLRVADRDRNPPSYTFSSVGFRCAKAQ